MEAIRGGWYLGEEGFKDKLLGLIDKAGAKVRKRGSVAGAAVRAHGESEARADHPDDRGRAFPKVWRNWTFCEKEILARCFARHGCRLAPR